MSHEPTIAELKKRLRKEMRERREAMTEDEQRSASLALHKVLTSTPLLRGRYVVMGYMAARGELSLELYLRPFIAAGGRLVLPRMLPDGSGFEAREVASLADVAPGYRGIAEPDPLRTRLANVAEIEAVLVPGVAFDRRGVRLGQGGGFYDRFLAELSPTTTLIGVGHDFQLVDRVPCETHDVRLRHVALPSGLVSCDLGGE